MGDGDNAAAVMTGSDSQLGDSEQPNCLAALPEANRQESPSLALKYNIISYHYFFRTVGMKSFFPGGYFSKAARSLREELDLCFVIRRRGLLI